MATRNTKIGKTEPASTVQKILEMLDLRTIREMTWKEIGQMYLRRFLIMCIPATVLLVVGIACRLFDLLHH